VRAKDRLWRTGRTVAAFDVARAAVVRGAVSQFRANAEECVVVCKGPGYLA